MRTGRPATLAPNDMVTSPHSLASAAGIDVLRAGGSAIDAAMAASAVLALVYPHMTGLGGDAFWLIHEGRSGEVRYLNGGGKAAGSASPGWMQACTWYPSPEETRLKPFSQAREKTPKRKRPSMQA
jgi:gamma-glutamyltranspeptidase